MFWRVGEEIPGIAYGPAAGDAMVIGGGGAGQRLRGRMPRDGPGGGAT